MLEEDKIPDPEVNKGWGSEDPTLGEYVKEYTGQVRLFRIFDFEKNRLIVLADGHGKYLRNDPIPGSIDHSSYVFFRPHERDGEFYPRPPASDLLWINQEYDVAHQQLLFAMRKMARKYIVSDGAFSDGEMEKLTSNEDMAYAKTSKPLTEAIQPLPLPNVPGEIFAYLSLVAKDFDEVAGQPAESRGLATAKTATQVSEMSGRETMREDFMRNVLSDSLREVGKKLLDSIQDSMTLPMAIAIEGSDGQVFQTEIQPEMIVGDFDVSVDVTEMQPHNKDLQRAQLIQTLQIAGQSPFLVASEPVARAVLEPFGIKDERVIKALVQQAQAQLMMAMAPKQPSAPDKEAPGEASTAQAQSGGER